MKQLETDKRIDRVFDALDRGNLLANGILPSGTEFDSLRYVSRLVGSAKSEILIIDPYSDATTLDVLAKKQPGFVDQQPRPTRHDLHHARSRRNRKAPRALALIFAPATDWARMGCRLTG